MHSRAEPIACHADKLGVGSESPQLGTNQMAIKLIKLKISHHRADLQIRELN